MRPPFSPATRRRTQHPIRMLDRVIWRYEDTLQREPTQADRDNTREMLSFLPNLRRQHQDALHQQGT